MKTLIKSISLCLASLLLLASLCSCGELFSSFQDSLEDNGVELDFSRRHSSWKAEGDALRFVGTWYGYNDDGSLSETLVLEKDGTGTVTEDGLTGDVLWKVDGDLFYLKATVVVLSTSYELSYAVTDTELTLTDRETGEVTVYHSTRPET